MATSKFLIFDEDDVETYQDMLGERFQAYQGQRDDIDEAYEVSDLIYKCMSHRGSYNVEKRKWVPRHPEGKANVGSVLGHRQVNTLAGILGQIYLSGMELFRYTDKPVSGSNLADQTGKATADQMNALAQWWLKFDNMDRKLPEFCTAIFKQSNIFAWMHMKHGSRRVAESKLDATVIGEDADGEPIYDYVKSLVWKEKDLGKIPTLLFPYPRNVYLDRNISDMQDQDMVIIHTLTSLPKLMAQKKVLDPEALKKIDIEELRWDGNLGAAGKKSDEEHAGREGEVSVTGNTLLEWHIYAKVPILNGKVWDGSEQLKENEELEFRLVYSRHIGNDITDGVCISAVDDFDPDGEIPIQMVRVMPDDGDSAYHTFTAEITRPMHAADSTLLNAMLDNNALMNDPPLKILTGRHQIKDFTFKSGQRWQMSDPRAVEQFEIKDSTQNTAALREQIRDDIKLAMATDDAKIGQYAGARTSATEFMEVNRNIDSTIALKNAYISGQFLPWLARKIHSYFRDFVDADTIQRIISEQLGTPPESEDIGEYDIVVDIIEQYEDDRQREMGLDRMMQIIGSNEAFIQSNSHRVDVGELMRMYVEHKKLPVGRLILPPNMKDSESNARQRIQAILLTGEYTPPGEGENLEVHERVARAERMKWRGKELGGDPRAMNIELLDQYIQDCAQGSGGGVGGSPEALPQEMGPGQEIAAEMGAMGGV